MAYQKWVIGGTTFDYNPSEDSFWDAEVVTGEKHPPTAAFSIIQNGGIKSARRTMKGIIKSLTIKNALEAKKGSVQSYTDSQGESGNLWIDGKWNWEAKADVSNSPTYITWAYSVTLVKR